MAETLSEIARRAKGHWGYPESWMDAWRDELTIQSEMIELHETWVAVVSEPAGFYVLSLDGDASGRLEHLWVRPESMGIGIGTMLFRHALNRAETLGMSAVVMVSDPNAERFYLKQGATRTGVEIGSVCGVRRELPVLTISPA